MCAIHDLVSFRRRNSRSRRGHSEPPNPDEQPHPPQSRDRSLDARRAVTSSRANGSPRSHVPAADHVISEPRRRGSTVQNSSDFALENFKHRNRPAQESAHPVTSYDATGMHAGVEARAGSGFAPPQARSSHQQQRRRLETIARNDSLSSDPSDCARPPPPKPHKHRKGRSAQKPSMLTQDRLSPTRSLSSEGELQSSECSSCDEPELESESVSDKGRNCV